MKKLIIPAGCLALLMAGCTSQKAEWQKKGEFALLTLDPGHFHAALVQRQMYPDVARQVHVYAPAGDDLNMHMGRIEGFNTRATEPTAWESTIYSGEDFFERMLRERKGNIVVLAGNNARKTEYILRSVEAGFNVLADKPMAITPKDFELLKRAFSVAQTKGVMLYDIMTERFEITTILQRELSRFPHLYGEQERGTADDPAVTKESVHHFCKLVDNKPLQRPPWFYDTRQQGEGVVDVTTHLTDLIQWELFPETIIQPDDIRVLNARVWPTPLTLDDYKTSTSATAWPAYLRPDLDAEGVLQCRANGEFNYTIKGVHAKVSVLWNFMPPEGTGDTHFSLMRGTKSSLIIQQGAAENYKPVLYVEPRRTPGVDKAELDKALQDAITTLNRHYPGISYEEHETGWRINIPKAYDVGHEAHFVQVTERYLQFLRDNQMPAWEVPNMLAKYRLLMEVYQMTR